MEISHLLSKMKNKKWKESRGASRLRVRHSPTVRFCVWLSGWRILTPNSGQSDERDCGMKRRIIHPDSLSGPPHLCPEIDPLSFSHYFWRPQKSRASLFHCGRTLLDMRLFFVSSSITSMRWTRSFFSAMSQKKIPVQSNLIQTDHAIIEKYAWIHTLFFW